MLINLAFFSYVENVNANVLVKAYKTADDFVKGFTKSISSKKGIEMDINQFLRADGSIDWDEYEKQQEMLANIFYKGVQDGTKQATQELKKVLTGQTDVVQKTPLKNLPGWSKVVISTGAALVGADLIYDAYQWSQGGDSGDLETIGGDLTSIRQNGEGLASVYGKSGFVGVTGDYSAYQAKYFPESFTGVLNDVVTWESPFGTFFVDLVTYTSYGVTNSLVGINKTGYSYPQTVSFTGVPNQVLINQNYDGTRMNFFYTLPAQNDYFNYVRSAYNSGTISETYAINEVSYNGVYGYDLASAANYFVNNNIFNISNLVSSGSFIEVIPYTVQEVPPLTKKAEVAPIIPETTTTTLIVPEGLTDEQIQEQLQKTPNIMSDPEAFLKENPTVIPEETLPPSESDKPITEEDYENLSCERPKKIDFSPIGDSFTTSFPFSIPWDIKRFVDNAFDGVGDERPSFKLGFLGDDVVLEIPDYFDSWVNLARMLMILLFDISVIFMFYRFMKGGSD